MRMWKARLTDKEIVTELRKHIDTSQYGIGLTKFKEIRKSLGLQQTCQQGHTPESIQEVMLEMRRMYPDAGVREMIGLLFHEHELAVSRSVMREYFMTYEPHLVRQRKTNRLQRHRFWAAGVNDIWAIDQHDKWLRFGLALHMCVEPFSGRLLWMKVWHSNHNPQLILSYYLETVKELGFIPMVTQSDPGTENFGVANAQTMLRQMHDPTLGGFVQHRWMRTKKNIAPEIAWSQLRRRFSPGFEAILEEGVEAGWMVFRWVFIPWLQAELDSYRDRINNSRKCRDKKKASFRSNDYMFLADLCRPTEDYGALDFKVMVTPGAVDYMEQLYITANHIVFDLIPAPLNVLIESCYNQLGRPLIRRSSVWIVYCNLLDLVRCHTKVPAILMVLEDEDSVHDTGLDLLPGLCDLHETDGYMGGVANGLGLQAEHIRAMDTLLTDEPEGFDNEVDAAPSLIVQFSSEDESGDEDDVDHQL
ncbi:hypothetical protein EDD15DRAFT_2202662 [Pisolithus albus]|nr:hypothetical protein EDD15DRAFT_2202662 [Pisolithus albus]